VAESEWERRSEHRKAGAEAPAAPNHVARAETHRRAGRLAEAEGALRAALARQEDGPEVRALLALVLWDQGRVQEARAELARIGERILAERETPAAFVEPTSFSDAELEVAFAEAETDAEQLIDPNRVAAEAILHADAGATEGLREDAAEASYVPGQAFVTETMARLLDRQGDERGAARIRAALAAESPPAGEARLARARRRARTLVVLERWLSNLRRDWA
jgi:hypothetical protein